MLLPAGHPDPVQVFTQVEPPVASLVVRETSARVVIETIADLARFKLEEHRVPGGKPTWLFEPRR